MVDILQEGFPALPTPDEHRYPLDTQDNVREYLRDLVRALEGQFNHQKTDADTLATAVGAAFTSPLTTKGDIMAYSSTTGRFPVGSNGQYVVADSTQTFGLKYQTLTLTSADLPSGTIIKVVNDQDGAVLTGTTTIPSDDTIPQNTEGDEILSVSLTPASASNYLQGIVTVFGNPSAGGRFAVAVFQDSTADAVAAGYADTPSGSTEVCCVSFRITAGTTSSTTLSVRAGGTAGTLTINGEAGARKLGGVMISSIVVFEVKA